MRIGTWLASAILGVATAVALTFPAGPVMALTLVRDAEIEATMRRMADPLIRSALLTPASVRLYLVQDPTPNAFVAGGQNIFLHTGLVTELDGPDQLRAVIAHELGHIAGGHQTRRDEALQGARGIAAIGMLGAAAAAVSGTPEASLAIATGAGQVANRSMLAYSRTEEASADQAGLGFLASAGGDPQAMIAVMRHFRYQELLSGIYGATSAGIDHPLWSERLSLLEEKVAKMPKGKGPSEDDLYWHARMVAKLDGFVSSPTEVLRRYPESDTSEPALLARAVAWHRKPDPAHADKAMTALLTLRPDDPYYLDLKAQMRLESGDAAGAVAAARQAVALAPREPLILGTLGRALLNNGNPGEARDALARSAELDRANAAVLYDLALAEGRLGNDGAAALATAERYTLTGRFPDAYRNAARAADLLPRGSPGWRRAQDLLSIAKRTKR